MNTRITRAAALACASLLVSACSSISLWPFGGSIRERDPTRTPPGATAYQCDHGTHFFVRYLGDSAAWVILESREFRLDKVNAGAGDRYSNGSDTLVLDNHVAELSDGAGVQFANCKASGG